MTRETVAGRIFVTQCFVATLAGGINVSPGQGEPRQAMIKTRAFPGLIVVAGLAFAAYLALVLVVFLVATQTIQRRIAEIFEVLVARGALDFGGGMTVSQWKTCAIVLESSFRGFPVLLIVTICT
jgi:hypothetical protein